MKDCLLGNIILYYPSLVKTLSQGTFNLTLFTANCAQLRNSLIHNPGFDKLSNIQSGLIILSMTLQVIIQYKI